MADDDGGGGYTRAEMIAGAVGALLFAVLLAMAIDNATGGRIFKPRKRPCGCGDDEPAAGDDG
jgi:hypothetical protein